MGGYRSGFNWSGKAAERLKTLTIEGFSAPQTAERLSIEFNQKITIAMVSMAKYRLRYSKYLLPKDMEVKTYKELTLPEDNYMISCDEHSPCHSEVWINRLIAIADKFKIRKSIKIGDLFDFKFIMCHYTEDIRSLDKEVAETAPVIKALDYFDINYLLQGNHERRVGIQTNSYIQAKHIFGLFGAEIWRKKFRYSIYDKMNIGKHWMVVHPQSYSQVATSVAKRLAEKFHRNIINSHGHLLGSTYDRSGKFLSIDLGCMVDKEKIDYINLVTTTHPMWKNGFGMLYNGHFYHFTEETDWGWWL